VTTQNNYNTKPESRAWNEIKVTSIRAANHGGSVRAYADVFLGTGLGSLTIFGLSVVQQNGRPPWIGFPQKPGKTAGKYFPVIDVDGQLRETIIGAVLDAFNELKLA
jgi:hypothetical protein